ncbi:hypothetical protein SMD22_01845 (plasmid) [Brevibacillus halotolerans]|nr:hypothetical protein SMD22_01845 [Brevibacillus halotolerans]
MGNIRLNAIVVTGGSYEEAEEKFIASYEKAKELFGGMVSNVVKSVANNFQSYFIAPDGSKDGRKLWEDYCLKRNEFSDFIDSLANGDGSNYVTFVDVGYTTYGEASIDRTNYQIPDIH